MKVNKVHSLFNGFVSILNVNLTTKNGNTIDRCLVSKESSKITDGFSSGLVYNTKTNKFIFVKQYRLGLLKLKQEERFLIETVAGVIDVGDTPESCMEREVLEEIGYKVDKMVNISSSYTSPGMAKELGHYFYIEVSEQVSSGGGAIDENEEIEIVEYTEEEMISRRLKFRDLKTQFLITEYLLNKSK